MRYMDRSRFWACDFWALLAILTCSCLLRTASGDPRTAVACQFCGNSSSLSASGDSLDQSVCTTGNNSASPNNFGKAVGEVIGNVTAEAIRKKGFAVGSASVSNTSAYALAQCWQNLTQSQCSTCLNASASSIVSCLPAVEGRALFAGCYMRYSTKLFWNVYPSGSSSSDANHEKNLAWEHRIDIVQVVTEELSYLPLDDKFNSIPDSDHDRETLQRQPRTTLRRLLQSGRSRSLYENLMKAANNANTDVLIFGFQVIDTVIQPGHRSPPEVWYYYNHNMIEEIVDTRIRSHNTPDFIKHVIGIGLSCTNSGTTMAEVLEQLRAGPRN